MSVYDKARELGEMMLETKEGKRLYDARFAYRENNEAKKVFTEYMQFRNMLDSKIHSGAVSENEIKTEIEKLNAALEKAKENPTVKELLEAENDFNALVNSVLNVLKETVLKDDENGCSGRCSSCGGCH